MEIMADGKVLANQRGQSIVQVLISIGIMGILMAAFASMMTNQSRESQALSEKLAALDLQQLMLSTLADGSICSFLANGKTFDSSQIGSASPPTIDLGATLPLSASASAPPIATVSSLASSISNSLKVKKIQIAGITGDPAGNQFSAQIQILFDQSGIVRSVKPAAASTVLFTTGAGTKTITRCTGTGSVAYNLSLTFLNNYNSLGQSLRTTCLSLATSTSPLDFYAVQGACARYCNQSCTSGCNAVNAGPPPYATYMGGTAVGCSADSVWCECMK